MLVGKQNCMTKSSKGPPTWQHLRLHLRLHEVWLVKALVHGLPHHYV